VTESTSAPDAAIHVVGDEKYEFFELQLKEHLLRHEAKHKESKFLTYFLRSTAVVLGSLTTVILGAKGYFRQNDSLELTLSIFALAVSAATSVAIAWETLAQPGARWVRARMALFEFHRIKDDLEIRKEIGGPMSEAEFRDFGNRIKKVHSDENADWLASRANVIRGGHSMRRE
jgi:hypothetical protein